jgi:hypothetical protein
VTRRRGKTRSQKYRERLLGERQAVADTLHALRTAGRLGLILQTDAERAAVARFLNQLSNQD